MKRRALCFVDDEPEEIRRFRSCLDSDFIIGAGASPESALEDLRRQGRRQPDLWVLDMYFSEGGALRPEQLERLHIARLEYLYAERRFRALLVELGQTSNGGFQLARHVSPSKVPFVFFTRKGTLEDAIIAYEDLGAAAVLKKPDPEGVPSADEPLADAYDDALRKASRVLVGRFNRIIDARRKRRQ